MRQITYAQIGAGSESFKKSRRQQTKRVCSVTTSTRMSENVEYARRESTESIFRSCMGRSVRKHGQRGGASFTTLSGIYSTPECEEHRKWRRGEKSHYKAVNRRNMIQTLKNENFINIVKAGMYGVVYKSNPCAIKY